MIQYVLNKPSNKKNRAKINIGVRLNMNLREKMTQKICLATRPGNENSSIVLKKKGAGYQHIIRLNQNNALQ